MKYVVAVIEKVMMFCFVAICLSVATTCLVILFPTVPVMALAIFGAVLLYTAADAVTLIYNQMSEKPNV